MASTVSLVNVGNFINKGNGAFRRARSGEYVDKSGMIAVINDNLNTDRAYVCITRCRRFGKSMAAGMLVHIMTHPVI